ncbi:hypothetical protein KJ855_01070 [Patescibacteria group bacterium]|nr:hypothetical protein [Patescibacteria group bacterium]
MSFLLNLTGMLFVIPRTLLVVIYIWYRYFLDSVPQLHLLILGFIFAPYTLLWYCCVNHWWGGHWGWWQIAFLVIFIIGDLTSTLQNTRKLFSRED